MFDPYNAKRLKALELLQAGGAACNGHPTDWWYPIGSTAEEVELGSKRTLKEAEQDAAKAKALCKVCPVCQDCLDYSVDYGEHYGIWGGLSARKRGTIRKHRKHGLPDPVFLNRKPGRPKKVQPETLTVSTHVEEV